MHHTQTRLRRNEIGSHLLRVAHLQNLPEQLGVYTFTSHNYGSTVHVLPRLGRIVRLLEFHKAEPSLLSSSRVNWYGDLLHHSKGDKRGKKNLVVHLLVQARYSITPIASAHVPTYSVFRFDIKGKMSWSAQNKHSNYYAAGNLCLSVRADCADTTLPNG